MDALARLPLPDAALPESTRRFLGADAPAPARMMAARGMVPLKGAELLVVLVQLGHLEDESIANAARATLRGLPEGVLVAAAAASTIPEILDGLADLCAEREPVLESIVTTGATASETIARIARAATEHLGEVIATNQQRILAAPSILESLYKNKRVRMSTVDRLVELAARNGVDVPGIPAFQLHAEALAGELIPEPSDEPLPSDQMFVEALEADSSDGEVVEVSGSDEDAVEKIRDAFKPLAFRIREMTTAEKIRFAVVGDAAARALLVRDPKRAVYFAAISSPAMTESEAAGIAHSREVSVDVLRYLGNRKEWLKNYDLKRALTFNAKTPMDISLRFLSHLRASDLKMLSQSRGVPNQLKVLARQRMELAEKKS